MRDPRIYGEHESWSLHGTIKLAKKIRSNRGPSRPLRTPPKRFSGHLHDVSRRNLHGRNVDGEASLGPQASTDAEIWRDPSGEGHSVCSCMRHSLRFLLKHSSSFIQAHGAVLFNFGFS